MGLAMLYLQILDCRGKIKPKSVYQKPFFVANDFYYHLLGSFVLSLFLL